MSKTTAVEDAVRGSIKIGRWTYPAIRTESGAVARNTKRDGDGDWVDVDAKDADRFEPEAGATKDDVPEIDGFTFEGQSDYDDLRVAYGFIFDQFATDYAEIADQLGTEVGRAKSIVGMLVKAGLVVVDKASADADAYEGLVIQSFKTYDDHTREQVMTDFSEAFQPGVKIRKTSGHGGKVGAQHRKPGKSTWEVGGKCPQGHTLEEGDVYVMPSGRKQCRKCRAGYPSNA